LRSFLVLALVGTLGLLVGCGSSNNMPTPVGVPVTIALTPASASLNAGKTLNIVLSADSSGKGVAWTLSPPSGVGTLSNKTTTSVTYSAPNSVASDSLATVTATSIADSATSASLHIPVLPAGAAADVQPISVSGGLLSNPIYLNGLFTSVTICAPNTPSCQTIDNILVDTGSAGLRILASQITIPLQPLSDSSGNQLNNCIQFLDNSFLWGLVEPVDIVIAGEVASATSIQSIATPTAYAIGTGCTGLNEDTQGTLLANGILGVGPEPFDCGTGCDPNNSAPQAVYYLCSSSTPCQVTTVSCGPLCGDSTPNQQVTNPAFNFPADNNGVILELPTVPGFAATVDGNMIFGIGTQSNNGLGSATVFTLDQFDSFTTKLGTQVLTSSFIDSGSNGLFFPDGSLSICASSPFWYCPASTTPLSATNVGANGATNTIPFSVDNFETVTAAHPSDAAFSNLAGPLGTPNTCTTSGGSCEFDWGLPFFYGRNVFTAINGTSTPAGVGPFWAY
jgi:hypothetical protein